MAKFNVVQKQRRAQKAERKRILHGDPSSGKLKIKPQPQSVSGKRKRKLFNKSRREQNEAVRKGLTIQDVEMAVAEGTSQDASKTTPKFHMKKSVKIKQIKRKGNNKRKSSKPAAEASVDAMTE